MSYIGIGPSLDTHKPIGHTRLQGPPAVGCYTWARAPVFCLFSTVSILYGQVVVFLSLPSAANLFWTKWCRVFTARMRSVVTAMCHPFSGRCRDVKGEPLPPMDPPPRSRWLAHELVAVQTQLSACAMGH
jgi:hypothetical protein